MRLSFHAKVRPLSFHVMRIFVDGNLKKKKKKNFSFLFFLFFLFGKNKRYLLAIMHVWDT